MRGRSAFQFIAETYGGLVEQLRSLAERLNYIADCLEPAEPLNPSRRRVDCRESLARRLPFLALVAEQEYATRRARARFLSPELLGEPAWDILLDLLVQHARGRRVSVTSACLASSVPGTTALRWLAALEERELVMRTAAQHDGRVSYIELTRDGFEALDQCLRPRLPDTMVQSPGRNHLTEVKPGQA